MTLKRRFFSAPTLTQAMLAAARHHSVDPEALDYQVVEKKQGFVKAPRGVVIEVDPDAPTRGNEAKAGPPPVAEPAESGRPELTEAADAPAPRAAEMPLRQVAADAPLEHPALAEIEPAEASEATAAVAEPEVASAEPPPLAGEEPVAAATAEASASAEPSVAEVEAEEEDAAPEAEAESEAEPEAPGGAAVEVDASLRDAVAEAIDELAYLAALRVQVASVEATDDGIEVELEGPDSSRLVARGGRALLSMQHLLPRLLFGRLGKAMHCHVDCDDFHAGRSERLARLAQKAAERVRSGGRSWLLEPMAPDERRLVHIALAEEPDVVTESVGQGFLKRVRVAQA